MGWRHIVVEGHCFFDEEEEIELPSCCRLGAGRVDLHCLTSNEEERRYCPFLTFGSSKSSIVITNQDGDAIDFTTFWTDEKISAEEWDKREGEWDISPNASFYVCIGRPGYLY